ncbi:MAG: ribonuclease PH [Candidatus Eisenbacteria bacterium]|uniref:Ribonuclease PH n=1 Tax=Eiseniibacteriota bacterium TaxID=2212470 RepID=A0A937XED4_UNCEI|nr:ribonuclease PH [Candidatus Eisenbacteria bacterium]
MADSVRADGRRVDELRPVSIEAGFLGHAEGSASIRAGRTWVLCAATASDRQPFFLKAQNTTRGWVTAEYGMLPRSVGVRLQRNRPGGREAEIQRLVGRSLRAVTDLERLPLHTITLDCDVIEADGGTRAAAITGAFVALCEACRWMVRQGRLREIPILAPVAAVSVGWVRGRPLCDLDHAEDADAAMDMCLIMTEEGGWVGLHATAESRPLRDDQFTALHELARAALPKLFAEQKRALGLDPERPFEARALLQP